MDFKKHLHPFWILSIVILLFFSFQYYFSSSVPIGGDAPSHVYTSKEFLNFKRYFSTPYPLSQFLFSFTQILPLSWEKRFIFWICLGYFLTGLTLGINIKKISGVLAGSLGIIFWAVSTWNVLPFYRDGTMPQLWSVFFLNLFIYFLLKKSKFGIPISFILVTFSHPATFAIMSLALLLSWPYLFKIKLIFKNLIILAETITVISILFFFPEKFPYHSTNLSGIFLSLQTLSGSVIMPALILLPLGLIPFLKSRNSGFAHYFILAFSSLSFFLLFSHLLGTPNFERRFAPYGILAIIFFGAMGLKKILDNFNQKWIKLALSLFLIFPLVVNAGLTSKGMYEEFKGSRSALRPEEKEAYLWIKENTPKDSLIFQTDNRGRGAEWLRVFAERDSIFSYSAPRLSLFNSCEDIIKHARSRKITHFFFYQWVEGIPKVISTNKDVFQEIYKNKLVTLFKLPDPNIDINSLCIPN